MRAIILVGGEGTRLRPLTLGLPKAVVPVVNRPMMFYILDWLKLHGVKEAVLSACYKPDKLKKTIGNNYRGIKVSYTYEAEPLGTGGAVKRSEKFIKGTTVVMNGDVLTDLDLSGMLKFHRLRKSRMTLALTPVENPSAYGVVETKKDGAIIRFLEKPSLDEISGKETNINAGVYLVEPGVLGMLESDRVCSLEREIFPRLTGAGFYGYIEKNIYWMDLGTTEKYMQTNKDLLSGVFKAPVPLKSCLRKGVRLAKTVNLGYNISIGNGTKIGEFTVLGKNCSIGKNCVIERSIIWDGVLIGDNCFIADCILANDSKIGHNTTLTGGAVLGPMTVITPFSRIKR